MAEYASNGKGNLGVTLGAIGTGLGALSSAGGLAGILGGQKSTDPGDRPVTRYEMDLIRENVLLKANQYTDQAAAGLNREISDQRVWNATQEGLIRAQAQQLAELYTITKLVVPNSNVAPGWGNAMVFPAPPFPPFPPVPPVSSGTTGGGTATA